MIKFYIHWWKSSIESDKNIEFYKMIANAAKWNKLLYIPFAKPEKEWNVDSFFRRMESFGIECDFTPMLASTNKFKLLIQIKTSKVIFVTWWDYCRLINHLGYLKYLKQAFEWKTIFWISAWSNIFWKFSYSDDYRKVFPWLSFICKSFKSHYNSLLDSEKMRKLEQFDTKSNIIKLPEWDFISITV